MYPFVIVLFGAFAASTPTRTTQQLVPRAQVPSPGPIPYQSPNVGLPNQESVTGNIKHFGLQTSLDDMKACLVAYGSGQFYDSWDGNVCGGYGWFKGSNNDNIDTYDCYQTCASWLEGEGFDNKASDYQCDFERGTNGHCWMGYHPVSTPSTTPSANSTEQAETA